MDSNGTVGLYVTLALDSAGHPNMSYQDLSGKGGYGALKFARWDFSGWQTTTVENALGGKFTSLVLDSTDWPHISYYDKISGDLKYAVGSPAKSQVYLPAIWR